MNPRRVSSESRLSGQSSREAPRLAVRPKAPWPENVDDTGLEDMHQRVRENVRAAPPNLAVGQMPGRRHYLDEPTFADCLNRQMRAIGISLRELARRSWLDIGYVSRL